MRFYDDFIALGEQIRAGAVLLEQMLAPERPLWDKADAIKDVEHTCDNLTHEIIQRLHRTFVTPLDREDIHMLASSLDDVIDAIDEAAANVRLYRLDHVRREARVMAGIIKACTDQIVVALRAFERRGGVARRPSSSTVSRTRPTASTRTRCSGCSLKRRDPIVDHEVEGESSTCSRKLPTAARTWPTSSKGVVVKHA